MKSVLLHAHYDAAMNSRLQVALDICRLLDAHLTLLHVTPYNAYIGVDPLGGVFAQGAIVADLNARESELHQGILAKLQHEDVRWDWVTMDGDVAESIIAASKLSDLVILSQRSNSANSEEMPLPIVDDVVVNAGCAVLVVPDGVKRLQSIDSAVIGWNSTTASAHAIRRAVPFLKAASSVHIASVGVEEETYPQTDANCYLSRHDIVSDIHELPGTGRSAAMTLHDFAVSKQASLLVMGAYGHSRLRETLLGGVTRTLLASSKIPLLLSH
ncbi:universal stress protein [Sphingorhabdus sp.]|jgi:nucleotide-binding universal stress UspA family protein|uniref:universal stress protein n=1 Tax=Sphingorhabdus sp. TaxID=1902408 RepID=UPI0037CB1E21